MFKACKPNTPESKSSSSNSFLGVQAKLNIGKSNDKYEREADRIADKVVNNSGFLGSGTFIPPSSPVQKKVNDTQEVQKQERAEKVQEQPLQNDITPFVQRKAVADKRIQCKEEDIQEKEDEFQDKEEVQKRSAGNAANTAGLEQTLSSSKGGGSLMDAKTKNQMESAFGIDFSSVRVHNDSNAVQMNRQLGAQAFTNGNDIYFNEGKYNPSSKEGQHLLAHELTHTVQQGASNQSLVQKAEAAPAPVDTHVPRPSNPLDITHRLDITEAWLTYLDAEYEKNRAPIDVAVKIGERYFGTIELSRKTGTGEGSSVRYETTNNRKKNFLKINGWKFFDKLRGAGVEPVLVLNKFGDEQITTGFLSVAIDGNSIGNDKGFIDKLNKNLGQMGFSGISPISIVDDSLVNKFSAGRLVFQVGTMKTVVDNYLDATGEMGIVGDVFTFNVNANISIAGLASGELTIARSEDGAFSGTADIEADIANVNARLHVEYSAGAVNIEGTGDIKSEKFTGKITLLVTDKERSKQLMNAALGVESLDAEKEQSGDVAAQSPKSKGNQVVAGWGEITANITPWLTGTAKVGIDADGHVTIVGEIKAQEEVELMEERGKKVDIFNVEIRAGYGIPLVGQVFLFANIGMFMNAGFGPLVLKNVGYVGTYSTDPKALQKFEITGTLNINAFAILGLEAEAGVGVTLIGHDVKAGLNVTAAAGLRAYAEATPTLQYKEVATPKGGKIGEAQLKGHFEAAAQLFLQLSGSLFYELDSPWWSPAPDGREDYPIGEVQYPIGDSMAIGADIDWLVGSSEIPELKFSPIEFDPEKFTADVMADPPPKKLGKSDEKKPGKWESEKNATNQQEAPKTQDSKGLSNSKRKKESLKNLPNEQKFMRALDEMSKLENADPKPTLSVVKAKAVEVKAKYDIDRIKVTDRNNFAEVLVKHVLENNKKRPLQIPIMSEAERNKLVKTALNDLKARNSNTGGEQGRVTQAEAQVLIDAWHRDHRLVVEEVHIVDGGLTWDYGIKIGKKSKTEKGKAKKGIDANLGDLAGVSDTFNTKSGKRHKLYIKKEARGAYRIIIESEPTVYQDFVMAHFNKIATPSEEIVAAKNNALAIAQTVDAKLVSINNGSATGTPEFEKDLDDDLSKLSKETIKLMNAPSISQIPEENIVFGSKIGSFGSAMTIKYLKSKTTGKESNTLPFEDNQILMQRKNNGGRKYYQNGHLLSAKLHGPNDWKNLTPLSVKGNSSHHAKIERKLKLALPEAKQPDFNAFKYIVIANYSRGVNTSLIAKVENSNNEYVEANRNTIIEIIKAERFVPVSLNVKSVELENIEGNWVKKADSPYNIEDTILNPIGGAPEDYKVTNEKVIKYPVAYKTATKNEFLAAGFSPRTTEAIIKVRENNSISELNTKEEIYKEVVKNISGPGAKMKFENFKKRINL